MSTLEKCITFKKKHTFHDYILFEGVIFIQTYCENGIVMFLPGQIANFIIYEKSGKTVQCVD